MKTKYKSSACPQWHPFSAVCKVASILLFGVLAGSAQTNTYLFTGSETNITLNPGTYKITAYGAQGGTCGGGSGGQGAEMEAEFSFSGLTTLTLLVGGGGARNPPGGAGGGAGGGSFVVNGDVPLLVAGGGGGAAVGSSGGPGLTGTSGAGGSGGGSGGTNGTGGGIGQYGGGGGGGYLTGGGAADALSGHPGSSFLSGGYGGLGGGWNFYGGSGGYGGGGGGGYSGGGGGTYSGAYTGGGGGGGSYISSNAIAIIAEVSGIASPDGSPNGEIIITAISQSGTLSYQVINGELVLDWAQGTLLSAGTVNDTYTPVNGASPPYTNSMTSAQQYFRVLVH
ncbi:MAG: hypothetical protein ACLQU3_09190 [Limisphaerales bacterium]